MTQQLIRDYVVKNFTGEKNGQRPRALFLVFRGQDAVERIREVVGHIVHERTSGETIRDTYGDYITDDSGNVIYFEPGVVTAFDPAAIEGDLRLWAEFSDSDGGITLIPLSRRVIAPVPNDPTAMPRHETSMPNASASMPDDSASMPDGSASMPDGSASW